MGFVASRPYKIVRPGDVYPVEFKQGDPLPEWAVEQARADGAAAADGGVIDKAVTAVMGERAGETIVPAPTIAKTLRACEAEVEGKLVKFRKGVTVYGETARLLIEQGAAIAVAAADGAPERK